MSAPFSRWPRALTSTSRQLAQVHREDASHSMLLEADRRAFRVSVGGAPITSGQVPRQVPCGAAGSLVRLPRSGSGSALWRAIGQPVDTPGALHEPDTRAATGDRSVAGRVAVRGSVRPRCRDRVRSHPRRLAGLPARDGGGGAGLAAGAARRRRRSPGRHRPGWRGTPPPDLRVRAHRDDGAEHRARGRAAPTTCRTASTIADPSSHRGHHRRPARRGDPYRPAARARRVAGWPRARPSRRPRQPGGSPASSRTAAACS